MFAASTLGARRYILTASAVATVSALALFTAGGQAQRPAYPVRTTLQAPAANESNAKQPSAKIIVDLPKPELLAEGVAIVQFRTENAQIVPVFGPAAVNVTPRLGHLHVTLDDAPWHWAHTSNDPVIVAPLPPGPHKILIELADANHQVLAKEVVKFEVPRR
jgi:hypothetical protein